jgi:Mg2+ and Co2+ transporter CorA
MAGLYGMNVELPGEQWPYMFWVVIGISVVSALLLSFYFLRKR